jgi:glucan phosphoethanolaminetransferase (alkaline phosphatase superfamily)
VFAYFLFTFIVIISTSFCGAYAVIKGISLYAGGFPDEYIMVDLLMNGEFDEFSELLTPELWGYISGWLVLFALGVIVQYKLKKDKVEVKEAEGDMNFYLIKKD